MHAFPSSSLLPRIDLVYAKTAAGRHEVAARGAGLNARQRTALIMLDGQRDARALAAVMPADQVASVLAALVALDMIAVVAGDALAAVVAAAAPSVPAPPAASAYPQLAAIKADLISAAETHLGALGADVIARVRQADDAVQLLRVLGRWHMAMQESKHGREGARTLLEKTKASLQSAAPV